MSVDLAGRYQRLRDLLAGMGGLVVGLSGGVDSVVLAKVAHDVLGDRALAVTADSPSLPRRELREAVEVAEQIGVAHLVAPTAELDNPEYAANPGNRCYFCRSELFEVLDRIAAERGLGWIAYGENVSDAGDHRPGAIAAAERSVRAPLKEAGLGKDDIRALAAHLGLPTWDKPAFACLASRLPQGTPVTPERLAQVEAAEDLLRPLGLRQYRVRHHGDIARIEVPPEDMATVLEHAPRLVAAIRDLGFPHVTLDLAGYRRGSLSQPLIVGIGRP
ncbi:MAG: ATP-dependent sacrificial sulfur transferase LarE [Nitriliruptorales bacterium]|nr:ATP-dependent sacrificial sulfur transferase LarE [Nitriliruptorales bacterium]